MNKLNFLYHIQAFYAYFKQIFESYKQIKSLNQKIK